MLTENTQMNVLKKLHDQALDNLPSASQKRIITDPSEIRRRCLSQPKISLEKARRSVIAGVLMGRMDVKGNLR
jgi:hypothetical protein